MARACCLKLSGVYFSDIRSIVTVHVVFHLYRDCLLYKRVNVSL